MDVGIAQPFGSLLRRYRLAAGLSQEQLAERAGLSARAVSALERGVRQAPYRETVRLLADALALSAADHAGFEEAVRRPRAAAATPTVPIQRVGNLPAPLTSFVGREAEIAEVARLLETKRLLTLTGAGGTGKTRLALAVAERVQGQYADGVWFVDLSPLTDPCLVPSAIAQTLGVREAEGQPLVESLKASLRVKRPLLVLDNFEQVVEAAPLVRAMLATSPGLTLLVTSRVLLRLSGECDYPVPPLPVPDPSATPEPTVLARNPAVTLFVQRARDAKPGFALTADNAAAVADICARLDGLPLALELAAARLRVLSPEALRGRLAYRLTLLTGGARDLPGRQRTLRDTIAWSYDLLTDAERALFRRLSVFAGGCTLEAAEVVCDAAGDLGIDVLDGLASLVEKSLLRQQEGPDGEPRFTMLATIREYALERLEAEGETASLRRRHAAFMVALAQRAEPALRSADRHAWDARLAAERDNVRAALAWALEQEDPDLGLHLLGALHLWLWRYMVSEGRRWAEELLAQPGAARRTPGRAKALLAAAVLAWGQTDYRVATRRAGESAALFRALGDRREAMWAQAWLVATLSRHRTGRRAYERACALGAECVAYYRAAGDRWRLAAALLVCGMLVLRGGERAEARPLVEESAALFRALGDSWWAGAALRILGDLALAQRDHLAARSFFEQTLRLMREGGDAGNAAHSRQRLAYLLQRGGEHARAAALLREALVLQRQVGSPQGIAACLDGLAVTARARGRGQDAARLCGAAAQLRESVRVAPGRFLREVKDQLVSSLRDGLGDDAFTAAYEEGRALSVDAAIDLALEQATSA